MHSKRKILLSFQRKFRIWVFLAGIWKKILPFSKSVPSIFLICGVSCKNKNYLHLQQKILYLDIFGLKFKKAIVIFEIKSLEILPSNLFNLQSLVQKKILKFRNKNAQFVYFGAIIWKYYCHIWNPWICLAGLGFENNIIIF